MAVNPAPHVHYCTSVSLLTTCKHHCLFVSMSNGGFSACWSVATGGCSLSEKHPHLCKTGTVVYFILNKTHTHIREREEGTWCISGTQVAFRCALTASLFCLWQPVMCDNWQIHTRTQCSHKLHASTFRLKSHTYHLSDLLTLLARIVPRLQSLQHYHRPCVFPGG